MTTVRWSLRAIEEMEAVSAYIAADNPNAAVRTAQTIRRTGDSLADFNTGRRGQLAGTHEKVVQSTPYIILYEIIGRGRSRVVRILRIVHGARNWAAQPNKSEDDKTGE